VCVFLAQHQASTLPTFAEFFASSLQGCFVDLTVAFDEVDLGSSHVGEGSDLLGTCGLSHYNDKKGRRPH
jgi:hypothetical protein